MADLFISSMKSNTSRAVEMLPEKYSVQKVGLNAFTVSCRFKHGQTLVASNDYKSNCASPGF